MENWVSALVTIVVNLIVGVFVYGRLTQKVANNTDKLKEHDAEFLRIDESQERQWSQINKTREDMGRVKGRLGMNGGTSV